MSARPFRLLYTLILNLGFVTNVFADGMDKQNPFELEKARQQIQEEFSDLIPLEKIEPMARARILAGYDYLDPNHEVPADLLRNAVLFFEGNKSKFPNQKFISIVNMKVRSDKYRFFLVHLDTGQVEKYHTTHGAGSDPNDTGFAQSFGNVEGSGKTSLGFARTAETYVGTYERSLRMDGLSNTNTNLRDRAVVIHGWDGAHEGNKLQGRTLGCLAFDWKIKDDIIDKVKEGSLVYIGIAGP